MRRALIKLLKFDPKHPASQAASNTHFQSAMRKDNYPNLLTEDIPGIAVKAYLVTYDYNLPSTQANLCKFARALCQNFETLQSQGHPKWKEVELAMPELGRGWAYDPPIAQELRRCTAAQTKPVRAKTCPTEQKILGLCE